MDSLCCNLLLRLVDLQLLEVEDQLEYIKGMILKKINNRKYFELIEIDDQKYHLREMTFIPGGEKDKRWKYITDIMTLDINIHFIEASLRIVYEDSLKKKYCAIQLFESSNGRIWNKREYENFKIGFRQKEPTLKLVKGVNK